MSSAPHALSGCVGASACLAFVVSYSQRTRYSYGGRLNGGARPVRALL